MGVVIKSSNVSYYTFYLKQIVWELPVLKNLKYLRHGPLRHLKLLNYDKKLKCLVLWNGNSKNRWKQIKGSVLQREKSNAVCVRKHGTLNWSRNSKDLFLTSLPAQLQCHSLSSEPNKYQKSVDERTEKDNIRHFSRKWYEKKLLFKVLIGWLRWISTWVELTCSSATPIKIPATKVRLSCSHFSNCGTHPFTLM